MVDKVVVNFSRFPFCFRCTKVKKFDFTNFLHSSDEFFSNFKLILESTLPHITSKSFKELHHDTNHVHIIRNGSLQYSIIKEVVKNICMQYYNYKENSEFEMWYDNNVNDYEVWQLGVIGGVRLIGIKNVNEFNVLFIDYHHLVYKDNKHNQKNVEKNSFCPINNYEKELI